MPVWEENLLDGLLNFAATPLGLLLLQTSGAIDRCVSYMFSRFTKKLQVSRCEKFGYGVMVTQVAATAPGVRALLASGWVRALVVELWAALEGGADDVRVVRPKPTPMEPIDRSCLKPFLSLVNLLSSSRSLWELLARRPLANKSQYPLREGPASIPDLIDRLVVLNSDQKIGSLFHYEQSHTLGLRSVMVDGLSVERNHILVRVGVVGGASERRLPPRALQEGACPYPWPMFCCPPLPACYTLDPPQPPPSSSESELRVFLSSSGVLQPDVWMDVCRKLFCRAVTSDPDSLTGGVLADLLEEVVLRLSASECFFSPAQFKEDDSVRDTVLSPVEQLGVHTCLSYGRNLRLLGDDAANELTLLMKQVKTLLSSQRLKTSCQLLTLQEEYPGHDWLSSTIFLLMEGNRQRSFNLLLRLSSLLGSAFLWPARIHNSVHLPREVAESGVPPLYWSSAHCVELLLKAEVPLVHSAFRMSGYTPSQVCLHWLTQVFWNYLDWREVVLYLVCCLLLGPDHQVYLVLALLKHLEPRLLQHTQSQHLQLLLKEEPVRGFRLGDYLDFMVDLENRYRDLVLTHMKTLLDPAQ